MTTQHAIHPYSRIDDIVLNVRTLHDASTCATLERVSWHDQPDFGRRLIDITESGEWVRLRVTVDCEIGSERLQAVVGTKEAAKDALVCLLLIRCRATKLRRAVRIQQGAGGKFEGTIAIDREDVASDFDLSIRVARSKPIAMAETHKATFEGALLGESDPITVILEKRALPYTGQIRVVWRNFSLADEAELKQAENAPLYVRTDGPPTVLLNEAFADLKLILMGNGGTATEVALRHAIGASIGASVWRQLTYAAVASLRQEEDVDGKAVRAEADWKGVVARALAGYAYPNVNADEALEMIYENLRDAAASQLLVSQIGAFADVQSRSKTNLTQALRTVRRAGDET
jgi:hypothetical protein